MVIDLVLLVVEPLVFHGNHNLRAQSCGSQHFWLARARLKPSETNLDLVLLGFVNSVHVDEAFICFFTTSQHILCCKLQIVEMHIPLQLIVRTRLIKV